jgi:peptidyl-prolyl cis-trans isomerase A (cyclophilin A)
MARAYKDLNTGGKACVARFIEALLCGSLMKHRLLAAALLAALAAPAFAQTPTPPTQGDLVPVAIDTSLGRIVVALDRGHAPVTTANFLHYVDTHRFDGEPFYRSMHSETSNLIQGGVRSDSRKLFPPIAHEPTTQTGLHNVAGSISMANNGPGTTRADFFILLSDVPGFDAGDPNGDATGFAAFGHVTKGMDVVKKIWNAPVSASKGEGVMKGQMLDPLIKIIKASRLK